MDLKDLINKRFEIVAQEKEIEDKVNAVKEELKVVDGMISDIIQEPVGDVRKLSNKTTGTVDVLIDGVMVKHNLPKKVEWDQEKLAGIKNLILEHDDNPDDYMTTKIKTTFGVEEKKYVKFPPEVKAVFDEARTVKTGEPKVSFNVNWR